MKAYRFTSQGAYGVETVDEEMPTPGPGEVLVRLRAASLNYRDLIMLRGVKDGTYSRIDGFVPLSDGVGEVVSCGPGAQRVSPGDMVAGTFFQSWIDGPIKKEYLSSALGGTRDGVLAEYCLLSAEGTVKIPNGVDPRSAATLPCAAVTAWNAVGQIEAGDCVLVQGSGGVSIFALQFALARGAHVIATSTTPAKFPTLSSLGAVAVVDQRDDKWPAKVRELTDGQGVDNVVETVGGASVSGSIKACKVGGKISLIGGLAAGTIDPSELAVRAVDLQGVLVGSRAHFESMLAFLIEHRISPVIDRTFRFAEAMQAYEYMASGRQIGKVVISWP